MSSVFSRLINLAGNVVGTLKAVNGGLATDASAFTGVVKSASGVFSASTIVDADVSASAAIAGSKLQAANGTTNAGVVSTGTQSLGGIKTFLSPITVNNNSTSDTNLGTITSVSFGYYYFGTFTYSFNNTGFNASQTATLLYTKIGRLVTLEFVALTATGANPGTASISGTGSIPSGLVPANGISMTGPITVDVGVAAAGAIQISNLGVISIFRSANMTTAFTLSATIGWNRFTVSYTSNV